jgi:hypothetical protein
MLLFFAAHARPLYRDDLRTRTIVCLSHRPSRCSNFTSQKRVIACTVVAEARTTQEPIRELVSDALAAMKLNIDYAYPCTDYGEPMPAVFKHWPGSVVGSYFIRCTSHMLQNATAAAHEKIAVFKELMDIVIIIVGQILASAKRKKHVDALRTVINAERDTQGRSRIGQFADWTDVRWESRYRTLFSFVANRAVLMSLDARDIKFRVAETGIKFTQALNKVQAKTLAGDTLWARLTELTKVLGMVNEASKLTQGDGVAVHNLRAIDVLTHKLKDFDGDAAIKSIAMSIHDGIIARYQSSMPEDVAVAQWFVPACVADMSETSIRLKLPPEHKDSFMSLRQLALASMLKTAMAFIDKNYKPAVAPSPAIMMQPDSPEKEAELAADIAAQNEEAVKSFKAIVTGQLTK